MSKGTPKEKQEEISAEKGKSFMKGVKILAINMEGEFIPSMLLKGNGERIFYKDFIPHDQDLNPRDREKLTTAAVDALNDLCDKENIVMDGSIELNGRGEIISRWIITPKAEA